MKKSAIRHILTAAGTVLTLFGLDNFVDIFEFANQNLDEVYAAVEVIVGASVTIYGFIANRDVEVID
tara:strand:+ start:70 stop:270 length:201 start_codon:yes stop_codon:yes gene_type:complete